MGHSAPVEASSSALTHRYGGFDFRLTGVEHAQVVKRVLA